MRLKKKSIIEEESLPKKQKKVGSWIFSMFCILGGITYLPSIASVLFLAMGVLTLPLDLVKKNWNPLMQMNKKLRTIVLTVAFLVTCSIAPTPEPTIESSQIAIESVEQKEVEIVESSTAYIQEQAVESKQEEKNEETDIVSEEIVEEKQKTFETETVIEPSKEIKNFDKSSIPEYSSSIYVAINNNIPFFTEEELKQAENSYEYYSSLDSKGRCGICVASIGIDIMPTEERGSIGNVKPSGWNQVKYAGVVDGNYLYNRAHLIGFQLSGENANTKNLITGTRYFNTEGMLPFENMVADYVKETNNHVLYRVTPIFEKENLLATGVLMEAKSVEDDGEGILFCVFVYNVQPGVNINYLDGSSELSNSSVSSQSSVKEESNISVQESIKKEESQTRAEPKPELTPQVESPGGSGGLCWKSATGSKYHSINDCGNMNPAKATQITVEEAIRSGLGQCSKCY